MKRVLVTGATGFAASHLVDLLLEKGYEVRVLVRRTSNLRWVPQERVEMVTAELRDPTSLDRLVSGIEWVFHFGGVIRTADARIFHEVNAEGTRRLADAALRSGSVEVFLLCSSLAAGGPAADLQHPVREDDEPHPITPYGRSKLEAERYLEAVLGGRVRTIVVRPPAVFGPRDESVLPLFRWLRRGWAPLPMGGRQMLSVVHVTDLAAASLHLAATGASGTFYVAGDGWFSWRQICHAAARALGVRTRDLVVPRPLVVAIAALGEALMRPLGRMPVVNLDKVRDLSQCCWICDISKLKAAGYEPRVRMEDGMVQTARWYVDQGWI